MFMRACADNNSTRYQCRRAVIQNRHNAIKYWTEDLFRTGDLSDSSDPIAS